ncbi:hypothetical protein ASPWEDRAFT_180440 [Aspergillus wentii DTO 134E9]|uniref:Uncharacterized protein n=1 Tax=Aspergillus wentii DTO 134E9 TaxID=1073089 RepID=A0A1L9RVS8_ASPWE|nr:uncharacterized protein ASPWEDRAFT_180440 [Aspergillus wentii DTO 134E9]OJJ38983.1 hypothetical protein ASPWEDRAFT_180440 [Aspergillus wentii DTO 134E9]
MYTAARCIQGTQGLEEKRWIKRNLGGKGGGKLDDLIALLFLEQFKPALQPTADGFTDERNHFRNISAGPIGPSRKPISQQEYLDKVEEAVLESDGLETYIEILKKNGLQMDENQIKQFLEFARQQAERENKQEVQDGVGKLGLDFEDFQKKCAQRPKRRKVARVIQQSRKSDYYSPSLNRR